MAIKQITINRTEQESLQVKAFVKGGLAIVSNRGMENYIYHEGSGVRISWHFFANTLNAWNCLQELLSIGINWSELTKQTATEYLQDKVYYVVSKWLEVDIGDEDDGGF